MASSARTAQQELIRRRSGISGDYHDNEVAADERYKDNCCEHYREIEDKRQALNTFFPECLLDCVS